MKGIWTKHFKVILGTLLVAMALLTLACGSTAATPIVIEKEVVREVIKEIPVVKEVVVEVEKPVIVEKIVEKEVSAKMAPKPTSVAVTDIAGRTVTVKYPVERVILGEGRQMYVVAALEPEDPFKRIVGWRDDFEKADLDAYNAYKEKFPGLVDIPEFGRVSRGDFSVEQAITLKPDVLILNLGSLEAALESGLFDRLASVGIPTVVIDSRQHPLENTVPSTIMMGKLWGKEDRAQELVDFYLQQVNLVYSRVAEIDKPKPTVFIDRAAGFRDCCLTFGRANLGLLIERAGGINIAADLIPGQFGTLNPEQTLVSDPDLIIITRAASFGSVSS